MTEKMRMKRGSAYEAWLRSMAGEEAAYKCTLNAQTYIDIRALATIDKFLCRHGISVRSTSEALREVVNMALATVQMEGEDVEDSVEAALEYLTARGFSTQQFLGTQRRQGKVLATALQAEAYARDIRGTVAPVVPTARWDIRDGGDNPLMFGNKITIDTLQQLGKLGYAEDGEFDDEGNGLPDGVMELIRKGKLPPSAKEWKDRQNTCIGTTQLAKDIQVPQAPLDRPETLEEAQARREAEAAREKAAMLEAIRARRGGIDNAKD